MQSRHVRLRPGLVDEDQPSGGDFVLVLYRHWLASKPRQQETALHDVVQRSSLLQRNNRDGYRPITMQPQRIGWQ
jgi:hypothetical protein